jgi:hypothetical protein
VKRIRATVGVVASTSELASGSDRMKVRDYSLTFRFNPTTQYRHFLGLTVTTADPAVLLIVEKQNTI